MKKRIFVWALAATLPLFAAEQACDIKILKDTARAFSCVARHGTSAVVFIESEGPGKADDNSMEMFREDFFNRFFGMPMPGNPEGRAKRKSEVKGSGFLVSADGYILTNNHVVENATKVLVTMTGGKEYTAKIIGTDPRTDLAVIKIEGKNFPYLELGDSDALEVGEWAIAIGNPFGLDASVTVGVVSAKGRNQLHLTDFDDFIQTDAAINPGNSGGPLLDVDGKVIGINTAIVSGSGGYMGVGFAVPSNMAKRVMDQLIQSGEVIRGYIGVALQPLDEDLVSAFQLKSDKGALAAEIVKDSPAEQAGLKQGDVIVAFNDIPVDNLNSFRNSVSMMSPGTKLKLKVIREGKEMAFTATVGTYPQGEEAGTDQAVTHSKFGFDVEFSKEDKAVVIRKVTPGSVADIAGLKPGVVITQVDRKNIGSLQEFDKAIKEAAARGKVLLLAKQGHVVRFIVLQNE